jgi:hypothetical protein
VDAWYIAASEAAAVSAPFVVSVAALAITDELRG